MNGIDLIGLSLFLIVIVMAFSTIGFKFVSKKITSNYFFWAVPALIFLIYILVFRYIKDWENFFSNTSFINGNALNYTNSIKLSKALLLDLCPFLALFLPISLILDKTRKTSYVLAPFCILGGFVSLGSIALIGANPGGAVEFSLRYIFIGFSSNELYFLLHAYLIIMGFMLVFQSNLNRVRYLWSYYVFIGTYLLYVFIIYETTGVRYNTTGISINDWLPAYNPITNQIFNGEYYGMTIILGNLPHEWTIVISYFIGWCIISLITGLQILFRRFPFNKKDNSNYVKKNIY